MKSNKFFSESESESNFNKIGMGPPKEHPHKEIEKVNS